MPMEWLLHVHSEGKCSVFRPCADFPVLLSGRLLAGALQHVALRVQGVPSLPTICKLMPSHKSSPLRSNGRAATIIFIISCLFKLMPVMLCNHDEDYALISCSKPVIRLFK